MSIIERLEQSAEGSRELDADVYRCIYNASPHFGYRELRAMEQGAPRTSPPLLPYTTSLDAVLTLFESEDAAFRAIYEITVWWATEGPTWLPTMWMFRKRLIIAALKAREKEGK